MSNTVQQRPLFILGQIYLTPGAETALEDADLSPFDLIARHVHGDWGELPPEDIQANENALVQGLRLLSRYTTSKGAALYVITEYDRSATTILLPQEY